MRIALTLTLVSSAIGVFSMWFFATVGQTWYGLTIGTAAFVSTLLLGFITHLLANEVRI
jgi:hypothetical protein